jgi:hypothetical protein
MSKTEASPESVSSSVYLSRTNISSILPSVYLKIEACQLGFFYLLLALSHVSAWRQRREKRERGVVGIHKRGGGGVGGAVAAKALMKKRKVG